MQAEVRIERYADQGRCVAHIDGRVVFVRFALPDELVRVELDEPHDRDDRFWTGEVVEVLEPSEDRVTPAWPLAGPLAMGGGVGGADLVHVSLPGQLKWKAITVSEQMSRLGHIDVAVPIERMPGDKAAGGLNWRTRIEMIADDNGMPSMRRRGTHNRVAIDTMPLARARCWTSPSANTCGRAALNPAPRFVFPCPNRAARSSIPRQQTTITPYLWTANCAPAPSCSPNR